MGSVGRLCAALHWQQRPSRHRAKHHTWPRPRPWPCPGVAAWRRRQCRQSRGGSWALVEQARLQRWLPRHDRRVLPRDLKATLTAASERASGEDQGQARHEGPPPREVRQTPSTRKVVHASVQQAGPSRGQRRRWTLASPASPSCPRPPPVRPSSSTPRRGRHGLQLERACRVRPRAATERALAAKTGQARLRRPLLPGGRRKPRTRGRLRTRGGSRASLQRPGSQHGPRQPWTPASPSCPRLPGGCQCRPRWAPTATAARGFASPTQTCRPGPRQTSPEVCRPPAVAGCQPCRQPRLHSPAVAGPPSAAAGRWCCSRATPPPPAPAREWSSASRARC
mmetsp:Transcript_17070/g.54677  ORF Transcript_17070/g.54677 Transcript_17070/m.54677 type:complete len:338 (-) Transcript_17070:306-1319(-)